MACTFPLACSLSMAYTESLFLLLAAACLLGIDRDRWIAAGIAASLAGTVRITGAVLIAAIAVAAIVHRSRLRVRDWLGVAVAPLGLLGWIAYQWRETGEPLAFNAAQKAWDYQWQWFTTPFRSVWDVITKDEGAKTAPKLLATLAAVFVVVGLWGLARRGMRPGGGLVLDAHVWIYTVGSVLAAFSAFWPTSILRYTFVAFPLLAGVAAITPVRVRPAVIAAFATIQGMLALVVFLQDTSGLPPLFAP